MKIIPHRGCWNEKVKGNSKEALIAALTDFDGVELDIRDNSSGIIIAHDAFSQETFYLEDLFNELNEKQKNKFFAINIKSDGLGKELRRLLQSYDIRNYMCFDLSAPESIKYKELGLKIFGRISDLEGTDQMYKYSGSVVDCFHSELSIDELSSEEELFIISPELHRRDFAAFWEKILESDLDKSKIYICTDYPAELMKRMQIC